MTDFDNKPEKTHDNGKAQGDPLLELTRLFGARSHLTQTASGSEDRSSPQEAQPQPASERKSWAPGLSAKPAGISMTGGLMLSAYGVGGFVASPSPLSADASDSDNFAESAEEKDPGIVDWQDTGWKEELPIVAESDQEQEALWLPLDDSVDGNWDEARFAPVAPEADENNEQILQALEENLLAADVADVTPPEPDAGITFVQPGMTAPPLNQDRLQDLSVLPQDAPYSQSEIDKVEEVPPLPDLSGGYFGYGQSVQINAQTPQINTFSRGRNVAQSSQSQAQTPPQTQAQPLSRPQSLLSAAPPPAAEAVSPQAQQAFAAPESFPDFSSVNLSEAFSEALHDFDLTIQKEKRSRRSRVSSDTIGQGSAFELSPDDYGSSSPLRAASSHDPYIHVLPAHENFAEDGGIASPLGGRDSDNVLLGNKALRDGQTYPAPLSQGSKSDVSDRNIYDWNVPIETTQKQVSLGATPDFLYKESRRDRKIYALLTFLLLIMVGGGYWLYDFYSVGAGNPVVIKAMPGAIKHKPETDNKLQGNEQVTEIYDQQQDGAASVRQATLLDDREMPVDVDLLNALSGSADAGNDAQALSSAAINTQALDPVDASILAATGRALPVHIVPTVAIGRDGQGQLSDMVPTSDDRQEVFIPAGDYRTQLIEKLAQGSDGNLDLAQGVNGGASNIAGIMTSDGDLSVGQAAQGSEITDSAGQMASAVDGVGNSDLVPENTALANIPALIPTKPTPPPVDQTAASIPAAQTPQHVATGGVTDTVLDERFYVQISSQPSQQAAIESAEEMKRRFAALVGANQVVIVPANINNRVYYRVRILISTRAEAVALCENYQTAGGSCFVGS